MSLAFSLRKTGRPRNEPDVWGGNSDELVLMLSWRKSKEDLTAVLLSRWATYLVVVAELVLSLAAVLMMLEMKSAFGEITLVGDCDIGARRKWFDSGISVIVYEVTGDTPKEKRSLDSEGNQISDRL